MIRPMRRDDKTAVLDLIRDTGMFTAAEVGVAEELIDVYLDVPARRITGLPSPSPAARRRRSPDT
jgi:hypothetical protein